MALIKLEYKSKALVQGVSVNVLLPTDSFDGIEVPTPYKTLYFLPGYSGNSTELLTYLSFRKQSELKGIAIVIPDGYNSFYVDHPERNACYSTFIGEELLQITRKLFPLSEKREETYIGGISMGGYGALMNGMKYRKNFSKIVAMSPAADACKLLTEKEDAGFSKELFENLFGNEKEYYASDANLEKVFTETDKSEIPELFLCCGTEDVLVYDVVKKLVKTLKENYVQHIYREANGEHDLDFWESMMDPVFSFLTGIKEGTKNRLIVR